MILAHLREDLARLTAHLPGYTETNILALSLDVAGELCADFDTSEEDSLRAQLEEAEDNAADLDKEASEADKRADKAEEELEAIRNELADLHDPESGESVASYRDRAIAAEAQMEQWRGIVRTAQYELAENSRELKALRARKGVAPGIIKNAHEIQSLLHAICETPGSEYFARAERLRTAIREATIDEARRVSAR